MGKFAEAMTQAYNMDCMEAMRAMPDKCFDLAIVDPPYGIGINMNQGRRKEQTKKHMYKKWDNTPPPKEYHFIILFGVLIILHGYRLIMDGLFGIKT